MPYLFSSTLCFSGPHKGTAERGRIKKYQKSSKNVKTNFNNSRAGQKRSKSSKSVKNNFSIPFDYFRTAPIFGPFWGPLMFVGDVGLLGNDSL